jgi:hypothetical protein
VTEVVEDQESIGEHEYRVRQAEIVLRAAREPLHVAGHVVAEISDGAALKPRQPRNGYRLKSVKQVADGRERVLLPKPLGSSCPTTYDQAPALGCEDHQRVGREERVPCPDFSALDRLEQEGIRSGTEPQVRGERCIEIGRQLREDRNEVPLTRQNAKLIAGWRK